jgi:hypothetical protein
MRLKCQKRIGDLENLGGGGDDDIKTSRAWESVRENTNASATHCLSYYELKRHKQWFDQECSKLFPQRKQAKFAMVSRTQAT